MAQPFFADGIVPQRPDGSVSTGQVVGRQQQNRRGDDHDQERKVHADRGRSATWLVNRISFAFTLVLHDACKAHGELCVMAD